MTKIDLSNMTIVTRNYDRLSQQDKIILRIGKKQLCEARLSPETPLPPTLQSGIGTMIKFKLKPNNSTLTAMVKANNNGKCCRLVLMGNQSTGISIFVERTGLFANNSPYGSYGRAKLDQNLDVSITESSGNVFDDIGAETPPEAAEVLRASPVSKSAVIPFTKLPMNVLEVIAQCKLSGNLPELIRVAKEVQDGNKKLGITVSVEL